MDEDTGTDAAVDPDEQLDDDGGEGADASEGGSDDDLGDVYEQPGEIVALLGVPEGAPAEEGQ